MRAHPIRIASCQTLTMFMGNVRVSSMVFVAASALACSRGPGFEPTEKAVLDRADHAELLSLDPVPPESPMAESANGFHGYRVLGRAELQKDERDRLIDAALRAVDESDGRAAKCFNPRHGLRVAAQGDTLDLVICFECLQMKVWQGAGERLLLIGSEQESEFDQAFARHSLQKRH